ncbi:MAG: sigma-70 family RNA polymerase sigma factor [Bryobacterales bacterium]|nr:sigma-70 family RNA polymerase sigma factor [Bryobacterales bacterium]
MIEPSRKAEEPDKLPLTLLLTQMQHGDDRAGDKAIALVYSELHRIASRELRGERSGHLLQTTALIHEAYTRLIGAEGLEIRNRRHFFALASQQMRRVLVDHARAQHAEKRGGGAVKVPLDEVHAGIDPHSLDLLSLDEALSALARVDPRAAQVVELRFFGGYTDPEIGEVVGVSVATVRRDWEFARSWLFDRMHGS